MSLDPVSIDAFNLAIWPSTSMPYLRVLIKSFRSFFSREFLLLTCMQGPGAFCECVWAIQHSCSLQNPCPNGLVLAYPEIKMLRVNMTNLISTGLRIILTQAGHTHSITNDYDCPSSHEYNAQFCRYFSLPFANRFLMGSVLTLRNPFQSYWPRIHRNALQNLSVMR